MLRPSHCGESRQFQTCFNPPIAFPSLRRIRFEMCVINVDRLTVLVASRPLRCRKARRVTVVFCNANSALRRHSAMTGTGDKTLVTIALDEKSPILSGLIRA